MTEHLSEHPLPPEVEPLRRRIVQVALALHRQVGPGFRESVYRRLLAHGLRRRGLRVREERSHSVTFEELTISNAARSDLIVEETIVVELKITDLTLLHRAQTISYLKAGNFPLGILFNFNSALLMKRGYERVVHPRYPMADPRVSVLPSGSQVPGFPGPRVGSGEPRER